MINLMAEKLFNPSKAKQEFLFDLIKNHVNIVIHKSTDKVFIGKHQELIIPPGF